MKYKSIKMPLSTLMLGVYFAMMPSDCFGIAGIGSLLKIAAVLPLAALLLESDSLKIRITPMTVLHLLFWLLAAVSLFYTVDIRLSESSLITLTLNLAMVLCMGTLRDYSADETEFLKRTLVAGSWITAVLMLAFSDYSDGRLTLFIGSAKQDANYVNGYLLFAFIHHLNRFMENRKLPQLFASLFFIVIVLMTGSRGAMLGFCIAVLVRLAAYLADGREQGRRLAYALMFLVLAVAVFIAALELLPEEVAGRFRLSVIFSASGTTGRLGIWKNLLAHFSRDGFPRIMFGHGYGATRVINTYNGNVAHNLYLDNLISVGLIGCVLQILIQAAYFAALIRRRDGYCVYILTGFVGMCMSLSLTSYTPLWNVMLLSLIIYTGSPPAGNGVSEQ